MDNASNCSACDGCSHRSTYQVGWCYMFVEPPDVMPCAQHDKYEVERAVMGKMIQRCPALLYPMVANLTTPFTFLKDELT